MKLRTPLLALFSTLVACSDPDSSRPAAPELQAAYDNLAFTCVHESTQLPPLNPEADTLYKYGRYLEQKDGPKDFDEPARYYRIAAAHDHYKASTNLQALISQGLARSPDSWREVIDLVQYSIARGIPGAYYDMGYYLERGYGVQQDRDKARVYFRRAADLGSPDAQFYVAKLLARIYGTEKTFLLMRRCAMEQGHRVASNDLAGYLQVKKRYQESVEAFQMGVKNGYPRSAGLLGGAFKAPPSTEAIYYMDLPLDLERSRRYGLIFKFLDRYESLGAKLPDIDQIVPLPPVKLPEWDGTFQWEKDRDAAVPPEKPSDELIERLSKEKGLDPNEPQLQSATRWHGPQL